jgi:rod shape-determining protein MreC
MTGVTALFRKRKPGAVFAFLLILCLVLMLVSNRNVVIKPKQMGQSLFSLVQMGFHGVGTWFSDTWNSIGELKKLREELEQARIKLLEYERVSRSLTELRRENAQLKDQLGFSRALPYKQIPAQVIARDPGNEFSTLILNKGSRQGVRRDMPVIAFQGGLQGLVGKVVLVGLTTATIKPITDPSSHVAARLQNSRYDGLVSGGQLGSRALVMRYVNKLATNEIQYGELVISSGLGGLFPQGIHIGRVREMRARAYEASLMLEVEPIVDFSRLEYVFVLDTGE